MWTMRSEPWSWKSLLRQVLCLPTRFDNDDGCYDDDDDVGKCASFRVSSSKQGYHAASKTLFGNQWMNFFAQRLVFLRKNQTFGWSCRDPFPSQQPGCFTTWQQSRWRWKATKNRFRKPTARFELPLNMNSLCGLGPVDFLSRFKCWNLLIFPWNQLFLNSEWILSSTDQDPVNPSTMISFQKSAFQTCDGELEQATAVRQSLLQVNSRNLGYAGEWRRWQEEFRSDCSGKKIFFRHRSQRDGLLSEEVSWKKCLKDERF